MRWVGVILVGGLLWFTLRTMPALAPAPHAAPAGRTLDGQSLERARATVRRKAAKARAGAQAPFSGPAEAERFFSAQRLAPGMDSYPIEHVQRARSEIAARLARGALSRSGAGPGGVIGFSALGPDGAGGRCRVLVFDPIDAQVLYGAGVTGGVFKSVDGGGTWHPAGQGLESLAVSALAVDPGDGSVLYAGTGEGFSAGTNFKGGGVFKSVDGGASWTLLGATGNEASGEGFAYVNDIAVAPMRTSTIFAGTRQGVWRSEDAGATWQLVLANPWKRAGAMESRGSLVGCTDIAIRTDRDPPVVLAAMGSFVGDGLYRSEDGGQTWSRLGTGADVARMNQGRMSIDIAPGDQDMVYVLMADNGAGGQIGQFVGVYRSLDGGDTWESRISPGGIIEPWMLSNLVLATGCAAGAGYSQGWHDAIIKVDPVDPGIVWVGGIDLFRSTDAGQSFEVASYWYLPDTDPNYVHADQHAIAFPPGYDATGVTSMYVANDGGVFRTDNPRDSASTRTCLLDGAPGGLPEIAWRSANDGFSISQFHHGDAHPDQPVYAGGAQDNGTWRRDPSTGSGWSRVFGGDGGYVAIDPDDPGTMYAEYQQFPNIVKTTDGGATWSDATFGITETDALFIAPFAMDASDGRTLWAGGRNIWRTRDGAATWEKANAGDGFVSAALISAIGVAPGDSRSVALGFHTGAIAVTNNALDAAPDWRISAAGAGLPSGWVSSVAFDPADANTMYATYSTFGIGHVYRSDDAGATWQRSDGIGAGAIPDIPAHWIAVRPGVPSDLYCATEVGVFASSDRGDTWMPVGSGLPGTIVESLRFRGANTLVAFTHGRGAWETALLPVPRCEGDADGNGQVNSSDVSYVIFRLGVSGPIGAVDGDVDANGVVNSSDVSTVIFRMGDCP